MDGPVTGPHQILNPDSLAAPVGFSHAVVAAQGRTVYLGGQAGHDSAGRIVGPGMAEQFRQAASNVSVALDAAGGKPEHIVSMQIYVTDVAAYRDSLTLIGDSYRDVFGRHYPATALFGVVELFDPEAKVELVCTAVIPESS
jgi:enamine deaminase RidA (YjgF/YER057c/UK114 family)